MGKIIELRVARLERARPSPPTDLSRMTDEELQEALFACLREVIGNPDSSPEEVDRAQRTLDLPWDRPSRDWDIEDLLFFRDQAMRELP